MDFTFNLYTNFLRSLQSNDFSYITFSDYLRNEQYEKFIILRHDVEQRYDSALRFAQIQNKLGIKGTYFFRILPNSFKPEIVKQIADLGHEIGYHYDDLTQCNGDYEKAIARFQKTLKTLRDIAPIHTICMDGSPWSKFDNKDLWRRGERGDRQEGEDAKIRKEEQGEFVTSMHNRKVAKSHYNDYGIIGEPYFDIDFDEVFYLTDTGRRWDGWKTSLRDKVPQQKEWIKKGLVFHSTNDIIKTANENRLPNQIMITFHPQRWHEGGLPWFKELVVQNIKNQVKKSSD